MACLFMYIPIISQNKSMCDTQIKLLHHFEIYQCIGIIDYNMSNIDIFTAMAKIVSVEIG